MSNKQPLLVDGDNVLSIEWIKGAPYIHCDINKWSPSIYRQYKQTWKEVLTTLADADVPCVFSLIPEDDEIVVKFQHKFGMKEVERTNGFILFMSYTE